MTNVVLIGFRGAGKSTLARHVIDNHLLDLQLCSTDEVFVERMGQSIESYVNDHSWEDFRRIEADICLKIADKKGYLIDCGGGVVENEAVMLGLRKHGVICWVHGSMELLWSRLQHQQREQQTTMECNEKRPRLLSGSISEKEEFALLYNKRLCLYKKYSDCTITTDNRSVESCGEVVLRRATTDLIKKAFCKQKQSKSSKEKKADC